MFPARTALLICAVTVALPAPAAGQVPVPAATYVVLGAQGPVARAVIPAGTTGLAPTCPAIMVDGNSQTMSLRAAPDTNFPILVCEFALGSAKSATIGGQPLPLPPTKNLKSIAAFGDTGCRLKADKNAALAARDTDEADEIDENGKFQDCNNTDDWPFAPMSATIAKAKPDLVVHVGDYLYRESACPSGDQGCEGSPHGDNWQTWAADFFTPAAPLLQAAPWIVVRGNHEICKRAGVGYARLLDPTPANGTTPPACVDLIDQYTVAVGGHAVIVLDSSVAPDDCPKSGCDSKPYEDQFKAMNPAAGSWLVTHRPIWGFTNSKGELGIRNMTLQAALAKWNGVPPKGIELVLSGHIHLWEALSFADKRSPQFVLGDGSTKLAHKISEELVGQKVGGTTVAAAATEHRFGYTIFVLSKKGKYWNATFYDTTGEPKLACKVRPTKATCRKS